MPGLDRFRAIAAKLGVDVHESDLVCLPVPPKDDAAKIEPLSLRHVDMLEHQRWAAELDQLSDYDDPCPGWRRGAWTKTLDAAISFIFDHGERAAELGWDAVSLFGVDPRVGIARLDACGALMLGVGWRVARVEQDAITFENGLIYRRKQRRGPGLPIWNSRRAKSSRSHEEADP